MADALGNVLRAGAELEGSALEGWRDTFARVAAWRDRVEREFLASLQNVRNALNPVLAEPNDRRRFLASFQLGDGHVHAAEALVRRAAEKVGIGREAIPEGATKVALQLHSIAVRAYDACLRRVIGGADLTSYPGQFCVGYAFACYGCEGLQHDGIPIALVTNDRPIVRAAAATGRSDFTLASYRDQLGKTATRVWRRPLR